MKHRNSVEGKYEWLRDMMNTEVSINLIVVLDEENEERWNVGKKLYLRSFQN